MFSPSFFGKARPCDFETKMTTLSGRRAGNTNGSCRNRCSEQLPLAPCPLPAGPPVGCSARSSAGSTVACFAFMYQQLRRALTFFGGAARQPTSRQEPPAQGEPSDAANLATAAGGGGQREGLDEEVQTLNADFEQRSADPGRFALRGFSFGKSLDSALKSALGKSAKCLVVTPSSLSSFRSPLQFNLRASQQGAVVRPDLFEVSIQQGHAVAARALVRRGQVRSRSARGQRHGRCLALAMHAGVLAAPWLLLVPACLDCNFTRALAFMLAVLPALSAICMAVTSMANTGSAT